MKTRILLTVLVLFLASSLAMGQDESPLPPHGPGVLVTNSGVNTSGVSGTTGYTKINTIYDGYNQNNTLSPQGTTGTTNATGTAAGTAVIRLMAKNIAFNMSTITVTASAAVTVYFSNHDNGIPYNFAVYTDSSAANQIFKDTTITGPNITTYTFTAPATPGAYFFRCDVHPIQMTGSFVVTSAGTAGTTMTSGTNTSQSSSFSGSSGYM